VTERPALSVVIPCYNAENYVLTVNRGLPQPFVDRTIVVDDGSTNRMFDIV